jgi:hypothetical protein
LQERGDLLLIKKAIKSIKVSFSTPLLNSTLLSLSAVGSIQKFLLKLQASCRTGIVKTRQACGWIELAYPTTHITSY